VVGYAAVVLSALVADVAGRLVAGVVDADIVGLDEVEPAVAHDGVAPVVARDGVELAADGGVGLAVVDDVLDPGHADTGAAHVGLDDNLAAELGSAVDPEGGRPDLGVEWRWDACLEVASILAQSFF